MDQPYVVTTLKRGEPLRERYTGSGGYGAHDPKEYVDFINSLFESIQEGTLPYGEYKVSGYAEFHPIFADTQGGQTANYLQMKADIEFVMRGNKE
ncbi:hypothetical protein PATA110616_22720 [Paenibacillus tarimensis]